MHFADAADFPQSVGGLCCFFAYLCAREYFGGSDDVEMGVCVFFFWFVCVVPCECLCIVVSVDEQRHAEKCMRASGMQMIMQWSRATAAAASEWMRAVSL